MFIKKKNKLLYSLYLLYFIITIIIIIIYDTCKSPIERYFLTKKYYKEGYELAKKKGKKLMIIGDPCIGNVGIMFLIQKIFPNSSHGDITIDLFGCVKCDRLDINNINGLKRYKTNGYVIVETGTLSFSKNIENTLTEIKRISGGDFLSSGGTLSYYWKFIGNKLYSNSLNYVIYPFNFTKDEYYKFYNLKLKKYKYIKF